MKQGLIFIMILISVNISAQDAGCISGNCENGNGVYVDLDGNRYSGSFVNGKREGPGKWASMSGESYDGLWKDDVFNGQGTFIWADGAKYTGEWKNGVQDGYGIYFFTNGDKYTGYFHDNKFHGKGKYTWADGTVQEGLYEEGKYVGPD
jgi:hypothetical protein